MIKTRKTWLASIIFAILVFAASIITVPNVLKAKADTETDISNVSLEMELGSSLRYSDKGGLRFMAKMDETTKDLIVNNEDVKMYFVITSKAVFDQYTSKVGTNYADMKSEGTSVQCIKVEVAEDKIYKVEGEYYANGVIGNISTANRNADLVSIAYVTNGTAVSYATVNEKAVGDADFSIDLMKGNVYKVANALMYEDIDDAEKILTNENYAWFATSEYPITIKTNEQYDILANKDATLLSGKYVEISSDVDFDAISKQLDESILVQTTYLVEHKLNGEVFAQDVLTGIAGQQTTASKLADCEYICVDEVIANKEIAVDGSTVVTINYVVPDYEDLLKFEKSYSTFVVSSGSSVSLVDDEKATGGKAMQGTAIHTSTATPFTINLGSQYKVSEVASVMVRYRITSGETGKIMGLYINEINDYGADRVASNNKGASSEYQTVVITLDMISACVDVDEYLTSLSFLAKDWANFTVRVDSIKIILLKDVDYAKMLKFENEDSLIIVKSGSNVSLVDDEKATGGKAMQGTALRTSGTTAFTINLGGQYKVSEVVSLKVTYRVTSATSGAWMGFYINEFSSYNATVASHGTGASSEYTTKAILQEHILTEVGREEYLNSISFIAKGGNQDFTVCIDSIEIITYAAMLKFENADSLALVKSGSNVSLVDDEKATDGKAVKGTALRTGTATAFTINLGGQYKVSEIVSVKVTYRVVSGQSGWLMGFFFNEYSSYNDYAGRHNTGPSSEYSTVTITRETIVANKVNEDEYLNSISLIGKTANQDFTVCIDSIEIVLK